jgi:ketosteroid isomerase-like protein
MAGSVDDFCSYFAPDAKLTVVGNPALSPGAGMRLGREDIARYLQNLHDNNQYLSHSIDDIVCEGDHVLVRWTVEVRFLDNGRTGSFEVLDHIRVRDGLIVELTHFYDTGGIAIARGRVKIA